MTVTAEMVSSHPLRFTRKAFVFTGETEIYLTNTISPRDSLVQKLRRWRTEDSAEEQASTLTALKAGLRETRAHERRVL
ncbi:MAG: hypothetical protein WDA16_05460 [Candidatus Thermoplasmatota archaeon]